MSYTIRPFHPDDLTALVDLMNRSYVGFGIDTIVTPEYVLSRFSDPSFETPLMIGANGTLMGGLGFDFDASSGTGWSDLIVAPDCRRAEVIEALLTHAEARTRTLGAEQSAPTTPLTLRIYVNRTADDVIRILDTRGYAYVRSSYRMQIALDVPIEAVAVPEGIEIRPFDRAHDAHAAHAAYEDSFSEHFGFVSEDYAEWERRILNFPGDDNSLWLIAWAGDQVAGFAFNRPLKSRPHAVWVGSLGVLKPYRQRGLGTALLNHSFKLFQERGITWAGLGVDASNATGAVRLYERAGMSVYLEFVNYRKVLRP